MGWVEDLGGLGVGLFCRVTSLFHPSSRLDTTTPGHPHQGDQGRGGEVIGFPSSSLTLGGDLSLHCSRTCSPARGPCTELQLGSFFDNQNDPFPAISPPPLFCTAKLQRGPVGPNLSQLPPPPPRWRGGPGWELLAEDSPLRRKSVPCPRALLVS